MKKNIKYLVFLVPALFSQIFAMENTSNPDQRNKEFCISRHKGLGWIEDGQDEREGIRFKDSEGGILVSYEHLDLQKTKPSPESTLWLFPQFIRHNGNDNSSHYYWVVTSSAQLELPLSDTRGLNPLPLVNTHGLIWGDYCCTQREGSCFKVSWQPYGTSWIEESHLARAFDLAIDAFSKDTTMDFKEIKVIPTPSYEQERLVLNLALQELELYEKENEGPAPYSIEEKFNELSKSAIKNELSTGYHHTLKRRVTPLANSAKAG